jgi:hypothetical protein
MLDDNQGCRKGVVVSEQTTDELSGLSEDLHRVISTWARQAADLAPTQPPLPAGDPDETRKRSHLAMIAVSEQVRRLAEDIAAASAEEAARFGAGYPELGEAAGISRQAARKRWPDIATTGRRRRRAVWLVPEGGAARGLSKAAQSEMRMYGFGAGE